MSISLDFNHQDQIPLIPPSPYSLDPPFKPVSYGGTSILTKLMIFMALAIGTTAVIVGGIALHHYNQLSPPVLDHTASLQAQINQLSNLLASTSASLQSSVSSANSQISTLQTQQNNLQTTVTTQQTTISQQQTVLDQTQQLAQQSARVGVETPRTSIFEDDIDLYRVVRELDIAMEMAREGDLMKQLSVIDINSLNAVLPWTSVGLPYKNVRPANMTVDELINLVSATEQVVFITLNNFGYGWADANIHPTSLLDFSNQHTYRTHMNSLFTSIHKHALAIKEGLYGVPSGIREQENLLVISVANEFLQTSEDTSANVIFNTGDASRSYEPIPPVWNPFNGFWTDTYYPPPATAGFVNWDLFGYSLSDDQTSSDLDVFNVMTLDMSYEFPRMWEYNRDYMRALNDLATEYMQANPEQGLPPVVYGAWTGPFASTLISRLTGQVDEDGNAQFTQGTWPTPNLRAADTNAFQTFFEDWPMHVDDTDFAAWANQTLSSALTQSVRDSLISQFKDIYDNDVSPEVTRLYDIQQQLLTNGMQFYDDAYPSLWRQMIPGTLTTVYRGDDEIATSFDFKMTGVSEGTIQNMIDNGGVYDSSTQIMNVDINHPRITQMHYHYQNNLCRLLNVYPGDSMVTLNKINPSKTWSTYTSFADILDNVNAIISHPTTLDEIEDAVQASGYSLRSFFDDFKLYLANDWIVKHPDVFNYAYTTLADVPGTNDIERLAFITDVANQVEKNRMVSDIEVLGYHYGFKGYLEADPTIYWPYTLSKIPSAAVVNAQLANVDTGELVYSASSPFIFIYRQHYGLNADMSPLVSMSQLQNSLPSVGSWTPWARKSLGSSHQGTYYAFKIVDMVKKLWVYVWTSPQITSVFTQAFVTEFVLIDPSNPFHYYDFTLQENNHGSVASGSIVYGSSMTDGQVVNYYVYDTSNPYKTETPLGQQQVLFHEVIFGHGLQFLVDGVSVLRGIFPPVPWMARNLYGGRYGLQGLQFIATGSSVIAEGWATYGEYNSMVKGFYANYTNTGELVPNVLDHAGYILSLASASRLAARQVVDVGVNSPRYAWSLGKVVNVFHTISNIPYDGMQNFIYRHYAVEAQQTTYAFGLSLNLGMRSILRQQLGAHFYEPAFAGWRVYNVSWNVAASLLDYIQTPEVLQSFHD